MTTLLPETDSESHPSGWIRLAQVLLLILALTVLMYASWILSRLLLPEGWLRPYFTRLYSTQVETFTFWQVFGANLLPAGGVLFMNLFRVRQRPGGAYVLPVFWAVVGLLYGTNSFVFAGEPVPLSITVLWQRTGFQELLAYTLIYAASLNWTIWRLESVWSTPRLERRAWRISLEDGLYLSAGIANLAAAVAREVA